MKKEIINLTCIRFLNTIINISIILCLMTIFLVIYKGGIDLHISIFGIHLKSFNVDRPISIVLILFILKSIAASRSTENILIKKMNFVPVLIMLSAIIIYFFVMPLTHVPCIQTETLSRIGYFNMHSMLNKWDSGWKTGILKQICNLDYGPRARYLHWLVEWLQAKIDVRMTYVFGFSFYYYVGVFTNLLNCFLVFLLTYKLFRRYSIATITSSFFFMNAQSLAVPFYRYVNKFKTITIFLLVSYIIISLINKQEYLCLKEKVLAGIRKKYGSVRNSFNLKNIWSFISESLYGGVKLSYLSICQNSAIFYILFFTVSLINSFMDEISYMCIIPWLLLMLFFRGIRPFLICTIISSWIQLFYISFYYIIAPKIWYSYYTGTWWNQKEDIFSNAGQNIINNLLFGLFKPSTYKLLFEQLGATLGYFDSCSFREDFIVFLAIGMLILISVTIFNTIKNHKFKDEKIFYKRLFFITVACLLVWQINSVLMGGRAYNFPYNYPVVMLSIPVGTLIGFCYVRLTKNKLLVGISLLIFSIVVFIYNIKNSDYVIAKEFGQCNSKPFLDKVVKPVQKMDNFVRKYWNKRPFYISYPNLTLGYHGVTPAGYADKDMILGFQTVIPAFFIRYFEEGDILSTAFPYEDVYVKKIKPSKARLFYDIFKEKMIDLNDLMCESNEIGEITHPLIPDNNIDPNGQLGLPEFYSDRCHLSAGRIEFDINLRKGNINNIRIGFFLRSIVVNDPLNYIPLKIFLYENRILIKEIYTKHDYGYSFKFYEVPLSDIKSKNVKLIIEQSGRHFYLAGPFLLEDGIWQDV